MLEVAHRSVEKNCVELFPRHELFKLSGLKQLLPSSVRSNFVPLFIYLHCEPLIKFLVKQVRSSWASVKRVIFYEGVQIKHLMKRVLRYWIYDIAGLSSLTNVHSTGRPLATAADREHVLNHWRGKLYDLNLLSRYAERISCFSYELIASGRCWCEM